MKTGICAILLGSWTCFAFTVHVDSFGEVELTRDTSIAFEMPIDLPNLELRNHSRQLVETCTRIGKVKGLNISPNAKLKATIQLEGIGESEVTTTCGGITCPQSTRSETVYQKKVRFSFLQGGKRVHEITAWSKTKSPGFLPGTAEVLCRGALHDFPQRLEDKEYDVKLD